MIFYLINQHIRYKYKLKIQHELCTPVIMIYLLFILTYSVDVGYSRIWKIIIDDKIYSFEIDTTSHKFCTNKYPHFSFSKCSYNIISLKKTFKLSNEDWFLKSNWVLKTKLKVISF